MDSLPQIIIWGVLLAVLLAIAAGGLRSDPATGAVRSAPPQRHEGRVVALARDLNRMEHSRLFQAGSYSRPAEADAGGDRSAGAAHAGGSGAT